MCRLVDVRICRKPSWREESIVMPMRPENPVPPEDMPAAHHPQKPVLLVALVALVAFIVEAVVMLLIDLLPPMGPRSTAFLDGSLLVLFLSPPLFFLLYRPMKRQIIALTNARNRLQTEITERRLAEEALRQSEENLRSLSSHLLSNQEKERSHISRELHEELAQDLTAVSYRLQFIERRIEKDQVSLKDTCEQNLSLVRQIMDSVRRLSGELTPLETGHGGLATAIGELIRPLAENPGMKVTSRIDDLDRLIPRESQITVYRILQEAVANVENHARATRLSLVAQPRQGRVSIEVEDNGIGFDKEAVLKKSPSERGLGLATMEERVRMLGGSFAVRSQPGRGTELTFTIPCKGQPVAPV